MKHARLLHSPSHYIDYYRILQVPPTASVAEIASSFRRLALKYHPDKNQVRVWFICIFYFVCVVLESQCCGTFYKFEESKGCVNESDKEENV
jgi:hypothetical protein